MDNRSLDDETAHFGIQHFFIHLLFGYRALRAVPISSALGVGRRETGTSRHQPP